MLPVKSRALLILLLFKNNFTLGVQRIFEFWKKYTNVKKNLILVDESLKLNLTLISDF